MQFVIVTSFDRVDPTLMVEERIGLALKRCGASITCEEGTLGPSNVGSAQRKRSTRPIDPHNKLHDYARTVIAVGINRVFIFYSLCVLRESCVPYASDGVAWLPVRYARRQECRRS